jgi:hypothetical protein
MEQAINGKAIAAFWEQVTEGTRLTCLGNTYRDAAGTTGIVTKPGKASIQLTRDNGERFYLTPPRTVKDTVSLTADTITYKLKGTEYTATWKIEAQP